ncbi:MAG: hypothetical protein KUG77_25965 [Nannocystaceae bacterium]|nr:hypothetical protein [Nannocystaceae bacterium]
MRLTIGLLVGPACDDGSDVHGPATTEPEAGPDQAARIALLDGLQPEGITSGPGSIAYVGTMTGGAILRVDLASAEVEVLVEPLRGERAFAGLGVHAASGNIFTCGAWFQNAFVFDPSTGEELAEIEFPPHASLINSVSVTHANAFFTDSRTRDLYRVPLTSTGLPSGDAQVITLGSGFEFVPGVNNANGIVALDDRRAVVVNSANATLYSVSLETGGAEPIDFGEPLAFGDGLSAYGGNLLLVRNGAQRGDSDEVVWLSLSADARTGEILRRETTSNFDFPTTAVHLDGRAWVVNARLGTIVHGAAAPDDTFELVSLELPLP